MKVQVFAMRSCLPTPITPPVKGVVDLWPLSSIMKVLGIIQVNLSVCLRPLDRGEESALRIGRSISANRLGVFAVCGYHSRSCILYLSR
jgi:hypothetical protein